MIKINIKGIRIKLIIVFWISIIISVICGMITNSFVVKENNIDYNKEFKNMNKLFSETIDEINYVNDDEKIKNIIEENKELANIFILQGNGNVIIKADDKSEKSFDLDTLKGLPQYNMVSKYKIEYNNLAKLNDDKYIYVTAILNRSDNVFMMILSSMVVFVLLFFGITHKEINYIKELCAGLNIISKGNFKYRVKVKGKDEISEIAQSINLMTKRLEDIKEKEKNIEKNKDEFIMNISHDLRTPLTSIIGYIELLKDKYKNVDELKEYINIIDLKSKRLDKLINDFFEYNKLSIGRVDLQKVNVSCNEFLRQVVTGMLPLCNEKNLELKLLLPDKEIFCMIDPDKMFRVMENLINNSIRYCDKNSKIIINLNAIKNKLIISIENTCSNFNGTDDINKLFERFYKGDKSRNSDNGGTGLGLAISKSIIELHGGSIVAEYNNKIILFKIILTI